jgi:DNA-binding MarR family transcriptional regulator
MSLTKMQLSVLGCIYKNYILNNEYPTISELAIELNYKSTRSVVAILDILELKKLIIRIPKKKRNIRLATNKF